MATKDPFKKINLSEEKRHDEINFEYDGVPIRATYNYVGVGGWLSRGTIALLDYEGHLMQKDPQEPGHGFATSIHKELIIPMLEKKQQQAEAIRTATIEKAKELINENQSRLKMALPEIDLAEMTLQQALDADLEDYLNDHSSSERGRKDIRKRLGKMATFWDGLQIKKITVGDIKKYARQNKMADVQRHIAELERFLQDVSHRRGVALPNSAAGKYLEQMKPQNTAKTLRKQRKDAANTDVLPKKYEDEIDANAWAHMGDPMWAASMLLKESGLPTADICRLKIADLERNKDDEEQVYVLYRRDDLKTATRDYTFPLQPCGGLYCNRYIAWLAAAYGEERVRSEKYLITSDPEGEHPLDPTKVNTFVHEQLRAAKFGYAGYAKLPDDLSASLGAPLLRSTRTKHLNEDCGLSKDPGARCFMLHRSMGGMVQADHYRSFTDPTGRTYLWRLIRQDRHGIPAQEADAAKTPKKTSRVQRGADDELRFRGTGTRGDMLITVQLKHIKEGDVIEAISEGGCYLEIIE